ncbi:acyl carrier protein [Agrobacterium genomosp. 3]|uniref:Acyl carrier protein n=2 Tax=Agrobacterium tumefaciens complex TaxID=1183400 RepID=A0AAE6BKI5_AGRTU|nr:MULTISPECIES: acyl carrier protein [Rhizobium/Agrobacterium group]MCA1868108.1 acyl carrier protein [Agrobacterium tomkonis]MCA2379133.1 acyl carrier protein [Agrobacterium tomkonis RTP8]KNY32895.1 acyl carrier protein [Agrobacterium sp. SUL3]KRA63493.1 acyl carrier protein [Rhizobium sp. Root651]MBP8937706.1 acyl carrier protein [Agrobacterium sp.]
MLAAKKSETNVADTIHSYLSSRFPAHAPFTDDTLLLEGGAIDSLGFLELMIFLGESFGIILDDEHFTPDNLGTPADLIAFVLRERRR